MNKNDIRLLTCNNLYIFTPLEVLVKGLAHFRRGKRWPVTSLYFILADLVLCAISQKWSAAAGKAAFCLNSKTRCNTYKRQLGWGISEISDLYHPHKRVVVLALADWLARRLSNFIIHQIFSLARDWSKRVTWTNIPQLKPMDNKHNSLNLAHSFPRAKLEENCSLLGTDNVRGQISEHIFTPNEGYCLFSKIQLVVYHQCCVLIRPHGLLTHSPFGLEE